MSRQPRIQFPGAFYHVFSRGNYRRSVFETPGAAHAFESCLFEACDLSGWRLHAFVVMPNHFHLALETPRGNLVKGMHWLQSTYSKRFNLFRGEKGHLFQGRYRALLVEPGPALSRVVNYIHLNPIRARLISVNRLEDYDWSSFRKFVGYCRPPFLVCEDWLNILGFDDTPQGWISYRTYLACLSADVAEQRRQLFEKLTLGWAIGSQAWQEKVANDERAHLTDADAAITSDSDLREIGWHRMLNDLLAKAGRNRTEVERDRKGADWKICVAQQLRRKTSATNAWIARELRMGSPQSVSVYLSAINRKFKN